MGSSKSSAREPGLVPSLWAAKRCTRFVDYPETSWLQEEQEDFNPEQCKMQNSAKPSFGMPIVCRKLGFGSRVLPTK